MVAVMKTTLSGAAAGVVLALVASTAFAAPKQGSKELRIGQGFVGVNNALQGLVRSEPSAGEGITLVGLGAGLGYFVTDAFELGTSVTYDRFSLGASSSGGPGVEPFVRLVAVHERVLLFAQAQVGIYRESSSGSSASRTTTTVGGDLGIEIFLGTDWALRFAPGYRHLTLGSDGPSLGGSSTASTSLFGVSWGIAAYF
jgi:opacity protein-like surface antigen